MDFEIPKEVQKLNRILNKNKDKNFIQRILNPFIFPNLDLGNNVSGTHLMASGEFDNKFIVYPEIVQDKNTGKLIKLSSDEAFNYALQNKEYLEFSNSEEADWFAKNYKKVWKYR